MRFEVELVEPRSRGSPLVGMMNDGHSGCIAPTLADASAATV
jgi:hypothetical protein